MKRKELSKYKMLKTERARDGAYLMYELWKTDKPAFKVYRSNNRYKSQEALYSELRNVRTVAVQIIAEETGRKYAPDIFTVTKETEDEGETADAPVYIYINQAAHYEPYETGPSFNKNTNLEEIRPYFTAELYNSLRRCNFETLGDILPYTDNKLLEYKCFGIKRIQELNEFYREYGLK